MKIIYRISDAGYNKVKPEYVNNKNCLANAIKHFSDVNWKIISDNISSDTAEMIFDLTPNISKPIAHKAVSVGHGAGTFNIALDYALHLDDEEVIYFLENDYIHRYGSKQALLEGIELGADFVTLYDHPDKYMTPQEGGNPFCEGGAEDTRVYLSNSCWWKLTNSTTMTFACKVSTLKKYEEVLRKHTSGTHPNDFQMFIELRNMGATLISPIPSYSTHGETAWLAPHIDWSKQI